MYQFLSVEHAHASFPYPSMLTKRTAAEGGAIALIVVTNVVGLPGLAPDVWLEPLGLLSLGVEAAYLVLFVRARPDARVVSPNP
jgi:hypothetical protein